MTIDLYLVYLSPPCRAVLMLAKHLNIELNPKTLDLLNGDHMTPEYLQINPAHTVPTIVDDGFVLWESRAVLQYLCNKYAPESDIYPQNPKERAQVDRMLNFDMSLFSLIREVVVMKLFRGVEPTEDKVTSLKNNLKIFNTLIGSNGYVASNKLSIADISMLATISVLIVAEYDLSDYPNVKEWFDRLQNDLPYFDEINGKVKDEFMNYVEKARKKLAEAKTE